MAQDQSITLEVVERIAELEEVPPEELQPPLHAAIDTDALNSFFASSGSDRIQPAIEFTHKGYTVRIDARGDVTVGDSGSGAEPGAPSPETDYASIANR